MSSLDVLSPPSSNISAPVSGVNCRGGVRLRYEKVDRVGLSGGEKVSELILALCEDTDLASCVVPEEVV